MAISVVTSGKAGNPKCHSTEGRITKGQKEKNASVLKML